MPAVPRTTSQDHAKTRIFSSESTSKARFTSAIAIIAATLAQSATGRVVKSPGRNTPRREPNVTPATLKTTHNICPVTSENAHASTPSISPNTSTATRDTRR